MAENNINIIGPKCIFCRNCEKKCPKSAITFYENYQGFLYPRIDKRKCVNCSICLQYCPVSDYFQASNCIEKERYFYGNSKSENILYESSSGGIFSEIITSLKSRYDNLYVVGTKLNKNKNEFYLEHLCLKADMDLKVIKKSKYIQSDLNDVFYEIVKLLQNSAFVVFCGTPCQVTALTKYLKKPYENLLLIDFICHGVPSKKLLNSYLAYRLRKKDVEKLSCRDIDFRNKKDGWENYDIKIGNLSFLHSNDLFFKAFLSDCCLRECCYSCSFKDNNRYSDITLGDLWVTNKEIFNNIENNKLGVSCVVTHTYKGGLIIETLKNQDRVNIFETDSKILKSNPSYYRSPKYHKFYKTFYLFLNKHTLFFKVFLNKCFKKIFR